MSFVFRLRRIVVRESCSLSLSHPATPRLCSAIDVQKVGRNLNRLSEPIAMQLLKVESGSHV